MSRKTVSKIRVRISSTRKMDETLLLILQKVISTKQPAYIYDIILPVRQSQRHPNAFNPISCWTQYFKNSFFPCVIGKWNKLNPEIRRSDSYNILRKSILNFIRSSASKIYNINDTIGIKLITRLRLGFSHLREHKFKHNFQDTLNPLYSCSIELESTSHYFLRCHIFDALRATLMNDLRNVDSDLSTLRAENLANVLLQSNQIYDDKTNQIILMLAIRYIKAGPSRLWKFLPNLNFLQSCSQKYHHLFVSCLKLKINEF